MKVGAENSTKTWIAVALMVVSVLSVVRGFSGFGSNAVTAQPPEPTATAPQTSSRRPARPTNRRTATVPVLTQTLDPRLRLDLLQVAEHTTYDGSGRNIFRAEAEPAPIPKVVTPPVQPQPITPPPPAVVT